jgi:Sec7-like guanine-nucleotide exchange factor
MATTKLTLSADEHTIQLAKAIAAEDNTSVSKLFKTLINEGAKKRKKNDPLLEKLKTIEISDDIKALTGILKGKVPDDINLWDAKYKYLKEKHGLQ